MKIEINLYNNEFGKDYVSIHEQGFDANSGELIFGTQIPDISKKSSRTARLFNGYVASDTLFLLLPMMEWLPNTHWN